MKPEKHEGSQSEQSITDCNNLGNYEKMREALSRILGIADHLQTRFAIPKFASEEILELKQIAESALSAPPRNCDVGTAEEQSKRHEELCDSHTCGSRCSASGCPLYDCGCSPFVWGQMPYEEGGAK